jgi:sugar lactone lactonase YvrE
MSPGTATLSGIDPRGVIEGARLWLRGQGLPSPPGREASISIGGAPARVVFSSPDRVAVLVPPAAPPGRAPVRASWAPGATLFVDVGARLATGLHQVDSPAIGPDGAIYAAFSGARGQESAVSVYRIGPDGGREAFVEGIVNATGLAVSPDGVLHVSSRYDGAVYRIAPDGRAETLASDLGVACGIAFAPDGSLFVGDRTGTIHRVGSTGGRVEVFASLPPSVAAFHLAMGPDAMLYVTAPTLSTHDAVHRFDASGRHETLDTTFGRPQGLAFDPHGVLHIVEALAGVSAVYRLDAGAPRRPVVSGPGLVGLAFTGDGGLIAATTDSLFGFPATS